MFSFLIVILTAMLIWSVGTGIYYSHKDKYKYCIRVLLNVVITILIAITPPYPPIKTVLNIFIPFVWLWLFVLHYPYPTDITWNTSFTEKLKFALADVRKRGWQW